MIPTSFGVSFVALPVEEPALSRIFAPKKSVGKDFSTGEQILLRGDANLKTNKARLPLLEQT
jgi:hypothetical protein